MSAAQRRIELQLAYVLHSYPWRETSLIVEVFSREHGRLPLVAKGARRPGSQWRGALMAFQPLLVSWTGRNEVRTLTHAEWRGGQPLLAGNGLLSGYYLNELLLRLMARDDAHGTLFDAYARALQGLAHGEAGAVVLRDFEWQMLRELGYAPSLDFVAGSDARVREDGHYALVPEVGVVDAKDAGSDAPLIAGAVLLAIARADFSAAETRAVAKNMMRNLIAEQLAGQSLESRRILMELQAL